LFTLYSNEQDILNSTTREATEVMVSGERKSQSGRIKPGV